MLMKQVNHLIADTLLAICFATTNSCSQTSSANNPSLLAMFEATTPCTDNAKSLLKIPAENKSEMMKWKLSLFQDPKTSAPTDFTLTCVYGTPKQGTRGFTEDVTTIELKGKWTKSKGTKENADATVYTLNPDNSSVTLSFLDLDPNLLHILYKDKSLMLGTPGWSYTLNRINPLPGSSAKFIAKPITSPNIASDSTTVGAFLGRVPCNSDLRKLNGIPATNCNLIKCQVILYQDVKTHSPGSFLIQTIYVGNGDNNKYSNTGKWTILQGTKTDPKAIVYQLNAENPDATFTLLKGDDNILFFLDKDGNFLSGNEYCAYTLNRAKK